MNITHHALEEATVVTLSGELDGKTAAAAQQQISPLIPSGGRILLDLSQVQYMSSAGLRMMLLLYRQALAQDSKIALVGLSGDIRDTMDATGFLDFFVVGESLDSGLKLLEPSP
ncbi:MAG: STAS domain-containing protein [Trueperaceae bacterium]